LGGNGYTDLLILGVSEVNFSFTLPLACFLLVFIFAIRARK
jgi:FHS family L-fucose permease-like MFS transporter